MIERPNHTRELHYPERATQKPRVPLPLSRNLFTFILLIAAACGPSPGEIEEAELGLAEARAEIERLAGYSSAETPAPAIPSVPRVRLTPEEHVLVDALLTSAPETWSQEERERSMELVARHGAAISALDSPGRSVASAGLVALGPSLLRAARLMTLRDRLSLLEGDEAAFLRGVGSRLDLALRLSAQPEIVGPLFGNALYVGVIGDVHRAVARSDTSREAVGRLDTLLGTWQREVPDPAAAFARHMLPLVTAAVDAPGDPRQRAELARDVVAFAHECRATSCRAAIASLDDPPDGEPEQGGRHGGLRDLPNLLDTVKRLETAAELTGVARAALVLRREALEETGYPSSLASPPQVEVEPVAYARLPGGGALLRLTSDRFVTEAAGRKRPALRALLTWELPPV